MPMKNISKIKQKKVIKSINVARVYVNATFNNTLINITDDEGNLISWSSAGHMGFKGTRKATPYAAQIATENAINKAAVNNIGSYRIYISGVGPGREAAIRVFQARKFPVITVKDITPIPHNGPRPQKPRKV